MCDSVEKQRETLTYCFSLQQKQMCTMPFVTDGILRLSHHSSGLYLPPPIQLFTIPPSLGWGKDGEKGYLCTPSLEGRSFRHRSSQFSMWQSPVIHRVSPKTCFWVFSHPPFAPLLSLYLHLSNYFITLCSQYLLQQSWCILMNKVIGLVVTCL